MAEAGVDAPVARRQIRLILHIVLFILSWLSGSDKPYKTSHKTLLTSTALKLSVEQRAKKHKQRENRLPEVMKVLGWYELHYPVAFSEFPWCACARRVHLYATCLSTWEHFCLRSLVPVPSWGAHPIIVTLFIWSPRATRQN